MARIRTVKPEFFTSEQIAECSPNARLLFVGLWCFCDDGGVHPASVRRLKMEIYPGDSMTDESIRGMVDELIGQGLLIEYVSQGQAYWHVTGWDRHQRVDKPTIKYPRPIVNSSPNPPRAVGEPSPSPRDGVESSRVEPNGSIPPPTPPVESIGEEDWNVVAKRFEDFGGKAANTLVKMAKRRGCPAATILGWIEEVQLPPLKGKVQAKAIINRLRHDDWAIGTWDWTFRSGNKPVNEEPIQRYADAGTLTEREQTDLARLNVVYGRQLNEMAESEVIARAGKRRDTPTAEYLRGKPRERLDLLYRLQREAEGTPAPLLKHPP